MIFLFLALVVIAIFHYFYQGVLVPGYKHEARTKLFTLRDELRLLKIENRDRLSDELFLEMQETLNRQIHYFDSFKIVNIFRAINSLRGNDEIDRQVEEFYKRLEDCPVRDVKRINDQSIKVFLETVSINSGGWISVVLPIYVIGQLMKLVGYLFDQVDKGRVAFHEKLELEAARILESPEQVFAAQFERCPI